MSLASHVGHQGIIGASPAPGQLASALQEHSLFVYFGHGGALQYLPVRQLRRLQRCSAALLMGCSSGRLKSRSEYEASGPVLPYLMAGRCLLELMSITTWECLHDARLLMFHTGCLCGWYTALHACLALSWLLTAPVTHTSLPFSLQAVRLPL